jgi:rod shape determining protein RodA
MTWSESREGRSWQWWKWLPLVAWLQVLPALFLLAVGVLFLYGTGQQSGDPDLWLVQLRWIGIGAVVWLVLAILPYRYLATGSLLLYPASLVGLVLVFLIGVEKFGAKRWIDVGFALIQPSEFAKLATVLFAAWVLSRPGFQVNRLGHLAVLAAIGLVPFLLILRQPDLGSSLVIVPALAMMVFVAGLGWRWIAAVAVVAMVAMPVGWYLVFPKGLILKDYQRERLMVFADPDRDPRGRGWNSLQSELAVGSGGVWGKGFMQGTQHTLGYLPYTVSKTDFIFSVIAEESGFAGTAAVIAAYALLMMGGLWTALLAADRLGRCLAVGMTGILFFHTAVNIGMTIRVMPVTGLPLPLVSYGGSFMVSTLFCLGVLQSIHAHRRIIQEDRASPFANEPED